MCNNAQTEEDIFEYIDNGMAEDFPDCAFTVVPDDEITTQVEVNLTNSETKVQQSTYDLAQAGDEHSLSLIEDAIEEMVNRHKEANKRVNLVNAQADEEPLDVELWKKGNELHLRVVGSEHPFVVCKRNEQGAAVVGINDIDTGCRQWHDIECLGWRR